MSLRAKLATTIAALCMVICLLVVGVLAATQGSVTFNGTVSFTATDINATITGTTTGTAADVTNVAIANWTGDEQDGVVGEWKDINLAFANKGSTIKVQIKVVNNNIERDITVTKFEVKLNGVLLGDTADTEVGDTNVEAWVSQSPTTVTKNGGEAIFEVTLQIADTDYSVSPVELTGQLDLMDAVAAGAGA